MCSSDDYAFVEASVKPSRHTHHGVLCWSLLRASALFRSPIIAANSSAHRIDTFFSHHALLISFYVGERPGRTLCERDEHVDLQGYKLSFSQAGSRLISLSQCELQTKFFKLRLLILDFFLFSQHIALDTMLQAANLETLDRVGANHTSPVPLDLRSFFESTRACAPSTALNRGEMENFQVSYRQLPIGTAVSWLKSWKMQHTCSFGMYEVFISHRPFWL